MRLRLRVWLVGCGGWIGVINVVATRYESAISIGGRVREGCKKVGRWEDRIYVFSKVYGSLRWCRWMDRCDRHRPRFMFPSVSDLGDAESLA